jgi:dTDP-4-dehydrorhamnose 3,5-epimerase
MKIIETKIKGLFEIEPAVFKDQRGYFFESFNSEKFREHGIEANFLQDNESMSQKNVLRGLHFQDGQYSQGKLVRVIKGSVLDVVVDCRKGSKTYGEWHKVLLSEENKKQLWIPRGFAHGFLTLEDDTIFSYKVDNLYNKESERCIVWNDKDLNIDWGIENENDLIISEKDVDGMKFNNFVSKF